MSLTSEHIREFFTRVKVFEAKHWNQRVNLEQNVFLSFRDKFLQEKPRLDMLRKSEAPYFNLFEVLNVRHLEETLHTPMLFQLLNPKGKHEQLSLYLDTFLSEVLGLSIHYSEIKNFKIHQEFSTGYGRIDLVLSYNHRGRKKLIIIENKIYAGDQKNQLKRYFQYAQGIVENKNDLLLVYLTPWGNAPSGISIDIELQNQLYSEGILKTISYKRELISWLETTIEKTSSEKVKQTIIQYLMTLYEL